MILSLAASDVFAVIIFVWQVAVVFVVCVCMVVVVASSTM